MTSNNSKIEDVLSEIEQSVSNALLVQNEKEMELLE